MDGMDDIERIPVLLLTGFLGSGKTTLLNHWLSRDALGRALVIVNEFGDVGLDHDLIASSDDDVIELAGGCACCVVRGDLSRTLLDVLDRRQNERALEFDRIVIETSGLAEPGPMLQMVMSDPALNARLRRPIVLCTFDAQHGQRNIGQFPEAAHQLGQSDAVIVTKTDLVPDGRDGEGGLNRASDIVQSLLPGAPIFDGRELHAPPQLEYEPVFAPAVDDHAPHAHSHGVRSIELTLEAPVPIAVVSLFLELLVRQFGDRVLRVKGLIACREIPDQPLVVQGVHHTFFPLELLDEWPGAGASSRLVIIASAPLTPAWCKLALAALIADVAQQSATGELIGLGR
jgi:G3E family GTPase